MEVDAVVLDIDGVLVDVANSYRRAIVETVDQLYGETIPQAAIQAFKDAGGFNNDWELTDAVALYVLGRRSGLSVDLEAYADAIATRGGGLDAAREVIDHELDNDTVYGLWDPERVRSVFQQLYLGGDRFRALEGEDPDIDAVGYITDEPVLIDEVTVRVLTDRFAVGILTGRPAAEAAIALDRVGLSVPDDHCITMDDPVAGKPDPAGLRRLAERLDATALAFVGDSLDDIRTVSRARTADARREYYGVGVLTGGLTGRPGRQRFMDEDADAVLDSVNDLPQLLQPRQ